MGALRPASYQLVPLTKLLLNGHDSVLICDGVGVGKTISAGYILTYLHAAYGCPALVICPPILVDKWHAELKSKFSFRTHPIRSTEEAFFAVDTWNEKRDEAYAYILPSSLATRVQEHPFLGPVVIDEIHNARNKETQTWAAFKAITASSSHRVGLSATPINNSLDDLAAEVSILLGIDWFSAEALIGDVWRPERRKTIYSMMTRFSKERLGIHFARRIVTNIRIPITQEYCDRVIDIVKGLRGRPSGESIFRDEVTYFRLAASSARAFAKSTGESLEEAHEKKDALSLVLDKHRDERVILFCEFEETAKELAWAYEGRPAFLMTGSVPLFKREEILESFRGSDKSVLIMTSVGAEGLDLQFCATLINYDLTWNPMVLEQRIGRIDRIGQTKDTVSVYNLIVDGSIDERIVIVLGRKLGLVEGSVLEPASVLGDTTVGHPELFLQEDLAEELKRANALAAALELSSASIDEDYELESAIDARFCDLDSLRSAASFRGKLPWIKGAPSSDPEKDLSMRGRELAEVIRRYQA